MLVAAVVVFLAVELIALLFIVGVCRAAAAADRPTVRPVVMEATTGRLPREHLTRRGTVLRLRDAPSVERGKARVFELEKDPSFR